MVLRTIPNPRVPMTTIDPCSFSDWEMRYSPGRSANSKCAEPMTLFSFSKFSYFSVIFKPSFLEFSSISAQVSTGKTTMTKKSHKGLEKPLRCEWPRGKLAKIQRKWTHAGSRRHVRWSKERPGEFPDSELRAQCYLHDEHVSSTLKRIITRFPQRWKSENHLLNITPFDRAPAGQGQPFVTILEHTKLTQLGMKMKLNKIRYEQTGCKVFTWNLKHNTQIKKKNADGSIMWREQNNIQKIK